MMESLKKAQVQSIAPAILALVFAAIILVLGLVIVQSVRDTDVVRVVNSGSASNESVSFSSGLSQDLNGATYAGAICSVTEARNGTAAIITTSNYTVSDCTITNTTSIYAAKPWNVTYTFTYADEAYLTANESVVGLATFSDFWEIIVLAIVISIVIGLLLVVFGRSGRR